MAAVSITDLNNAKLDVDHMADLATSSELEATDRFGNTKKTWAGIEQELGSKYAVNVTGANRLAAEAAAADAESAASAALAAGHVYNTTSQGLAATTNGQTFLLRTATPQSYLVYVNNSGVADPQGTLTIASTASVNRNDDRIVDAAGELTRFGIVATPSVGTGTLSNGTYVFAPPVVRDGYLKKLSLYAAATGTVKAKRFIRSGDVFTFVSEISLSVNATGLNVFTSADFGEFPLVHGQLLGFYAATGIVALATGAADPRSAWFSTASDVTTNFTDTTVSQVTQFQIALDVASYEDSKDALDRVAASVSNSVESAGRVGFAGTPVTGSALSVGTYVFSPVAVKTGRLTRVGLYAGAAGTLKIKRFTKSGSTFTFVDEVAVWINAAGSVVLTPDDFGEFPVLAGELLGFYAPTGLVMFTATASDLNSGFFGVSTTDVMTSFVDATIATNVQFQIGFDVATVGLTVARVTGVARAALPKLTLGALNLSATGGNASIGTFLYNQAVAADGVLERFRVRMSTAGIISRVVYTKSGDDFTLVRTEDFNLPTGDQWVEDGIALQAGQYLGIAEASAGGKIYASTELVGPDLAWRFSSTIGGNFTTATIGTAARLHMEFHLSFETDLKNAHPLTIFNSDRIAVSGDSLTTGFYQQAGKCYLSKVSLFSDWCFDSMAVSGERADQQLARIRTGSIVYNDRPWIGFGAKYAISMLGANDAATLTLAQYIEKQRQLVQTHRGLGAIPIVSTEYTPPNFISNTTPDPYYQVAVKQLCEEEGALFCDLLSHTHTMDFGTKYADFFATAGTAHPGVRTNHLIADPLERFLRQLGRPQQSLKLFRKRVGFSVAALGDLMFDNLLDRGQRFLEINIGHRALATGSEKNYDDLMPISGYTPGALIESEYLQLMAGKAVAFPDYGLVEAVFDAQSKNIEKVEITLSDAAVELYIRDTIGTPVQADGLPVGTWRQIGGVNGKFVIRTADLIRAMRFDKLSMLLHKTGGFSITEPKIVMYGERGKPAAPVLTSQDYARGAELLAKTDCNSTTGWTLTGSPAAAVPADSMLPRGAAACITVNGSDKIAQTLNYPQDDRWDREVEIRVRCRRWVPIFSSGGDYSTAPITNESFDWTRVVVELISPSSAMPIKGKVGLWWDDVVFRTVLPVGTSSMTLRVSAEDTVQVAMVSAKTVNA